MQVCLKKDIELDYIFILKTCFHEIYAISYIPQGPVFGFSDFASEKNCLGPTLSATLCLHSLLLLALTTPLAQHSLFFLSLFPLFLIAHLPTLFFFLSSFSIVFLFFFMLSSFSITPFSLPSFAFSAFSLQ